MSSLVLAGLREAVDGDSWALIALIGACWAEYPGCVMDIAGEYPELLAPASSFQKTGGKMWALPEGPWVSACVGLVPGPGRLVELIRLYVAPHRRREGVGTALVELIEHQARVGGAIGIELWSDTRFDDAHRLYQRLGYTPTGATRDLHDLSHSTEYAFYKPL